MLATYRKQATTRLAELPARVKAEAAAAAKEGRQPFQIVPLVEVSPSVLGPALEKLTQIPGELEDVVGALRTVCSRQNVPFSMRADQLQAVLNAAGVKDENV